MIRKWAILLGVAILYGATVNAEPPKRFSRHFSGHRALWSLNWDLISPYDPIFRHVGELHDYDWRFLAAISYAESRFDPQIVSGAGAVGLMQVMPSSAERYGIHPEDVTDPLTNVWLGVCVLDNIFETLRFPHWISERDRLSIVLASYNSGIGHVLDARRLAVKYGENYNSWAVVSKYLELLAYPLYFTDEVVVAGSFQGAAETRTFARRVLLAYDRFGRLTQM